MLHLKLSVLISFEIHRAKRKKKRVEIGFTELHLRWHLFLPATISIQNFALPFLLCFPINFSQ